MINRKTPPNTSSFGTLPAIAPQFDILGSGVQVYVVDGGLDHIIKLQLIFKAGSNNETTPLAAAAMVKLFKGGTHNKSALQIEEWLDFYGASYEAVALNDIITVSVTTLSRHLSKVLQIIPEIIFQPVFPPEELALEMQNMLAQFTVSLDRVDFIARRSFKSQIFGPEHPYGYLLHPDHFLAVNREHLVDFHKTWIRPENLIVIVSGKIPDNLVTVLKECFGDFCGFSANPVAGNHANFQVNPGEKQLFIEKPGAIQSAIRLGKRIILKKHPDYVKLEVANALLGGFFGSRLMTNIRQKKGLTYGIHSSLVSMLHDSFFFIGAQTSNSGVKSTILETYREVETLRAIPPAPEELNNLRNYLAGQLLRNFDGPFAMAQRLKEILVFDLGNDFYEKALDTIYSITPDEIQQMAFTYLDTSDMYETIVGGSPD